MGQEGSTHADRRTLAAHQRLGSRRRSGLGARRAVDRWRGRPGLRRRWSSRAHAYLERHNAGWDDHLSVLLKQAEDETGSGKLCYPDPDWKRFDLHVAIDATPEDVLRFWSTARGMEDFFVEMMRITGPDGLEREIDEIAMSGDRYTWRWHSGYRLSGEYLPPAKADEIRFSFGDSTVAVRAIPHGKGCLLRLSQFDIPDTEYARMNVHVNCRAAWVYFLTVLKIRIEQGIDGRDTTRETGASFSTAFNPQRIGVTF